MADEATLLGAAETPPTDPATPPAVDPAVAPPAADPATPPANETPEAKAAREAKEAEEAKAKAGAPEKYEDFKVPEGYELKPETVAAIAPLFKELNLTQDQAQKLVDAQTKMNTEAAEAQTKAWTELRAGWVKTAREDKEIGGDKFDANLGLAKKAMEKLGTPALSEALNQTGMGDHPEMIRLMVKLGSLVAEDKLHFGSASGATPKSAAEILYGGSA